MRSVRSLYYRASPDARECDLLRAMHIEVVRTMERVRRQALLEGQTLLDANARAAREPVDEPGASDERGASPSSSALPASLHENDDGPSGDER
jgi:hypothetical protein